MKRCCFVGNRDSDGGGVACVHALVESLVRQGVEEFYVGTYGRFDDTAAEAMLPIKAAYPNVGLYQVLAYHPAQKKTALRKGFDDMFYPLENASPPQYAIARANRKIIDLSDVVIACVRHPGCASKLLAYAQRRQKRGLLQLILLP